MLDGKRTATQTQKNKSIVLRVGINIYGRYLKSIEAKITSNCVYHINAETYSKYSTTFNSHPMFSRYFLVYADLDGLEKADKRYLDFLKTISSVRWIFLVIRTRVKETFDQLKYIKGFSEFQYLDCYNLPKETLNAYIRAELLSNGAPKEKVTEDVVNRIRKRVRYKEYVLDSVLPRIACSDLQIKDINRLITPYSGVTLANFGRRFFEPKKAKPVADLLCNYRKYPDVLLKAVIDYLDDWFKLYAVYATGEFCEDTILDWIASNGSKFKIAYEYQARQWLSSFISYSYDFMLFVYIQLHSVVHASAMEKMAILYKVYRMINCE